TGKIISLVDGGSVTINADDADSDPTNEIQTLSSTDGSVTLVKTGDDYDLSVAVADGTETKVNAGANVTVAGDGSIATPYVVSVATLDDADADPTNELITSANLTGTDLNIIDAGGTTTIDLSSLNNSGTDDQTLTLVGNNLSIEDGNTVVLPTADGTETKVNAGTNVTVAGNGSIATPYVVSVATLDDADSDPTNELSDLNLAANILTLTNPATGGNQVDLSSYVNTDTQDLSIDGTGKIISLVDGGSVTINADDADADPTNEIQTLSSTDGSVTLVKTGDDYDLSVAVVDGTETKVNAGTNVSVAGDGSIATPYVVSVATLDDADADPSNELITSANLTGTDLNIIDAGGTTTIDLSSLNNSGTDDQTLTLVGNNLSIEDGNTVVLPTADGTETKVTAGTNVTVAGTGSTASPYVVSVASLNDADADPNNELQTVSRTGSDVTLSNGGGTVSINDADSVIGNETITSMTFSGSTLTVNEGGNTPKTVNLGALNTDDQKIDKFVLNGTTLELSVEDDGEADKTVNLNGTFATDAELAASDAADLDKVVGNEVTNATDATLIRSGSGTTASPYTLDVATGGITSTEILDGTVATVDLANNAVTGAKILDGTVATADLANNSVTSAKIVDGTIATADIASTGNNKVLVTSPAGIVEWIDKSALVPTTTVSNTSTVNTLTTTVNSVTGTGVNIINSNALSLSGSNLTSTVNGVASAALNLSSFLDNTDDQTAAEVNVVTPVDVDGDGTTEATVEDVIQDIAPIVSKAARIFYPPSIAVDASTNGTFTIDLYAQYIAQYGSPTVGSAGAPAALPTYTAAELYYYVTYADPTVFNTGTMSIAADGKLTYTIIGQPSDYNSLINVVFVVK
ncbi:beta strand repeat-containing protein, partial [Sediminicola luteus]